MTARNWTTRLKRLERQDPTFRVKSNAETGQTIISGMGELHLEVIRHRMERDFNLKVRFHKPRVSYRERLIGEISVNVDFSEESAVWNDWIWRFAARKGSSRFGNRITVGHRLAPEAMPKQLLQILA